MLKTLIKKWVFLLLIIIFNLIIALRTSIGIFYLFFWFLITTIAISLLFITLQYLGAGLNLSRKVVGKIEEDDFSEIELLVNNEGFLPLFNVVLEDYLSPAIPEERKKRVLLNYLGAQSSLNIKYSCQCPLRGKYIIDPLVVYFFDPLGLVFLKKTYTLNSELYVYPKTFRIQKFPPLVKGVLPWFGIGTRRVSGDEDEFYGVREYKDGDPIKKIHWFSSARKNMLIVKEFQCQSFSRATIMFNLEKALNFGEGKESVAEYSIKIAASVAKYLMEKGVSLEIIAHTEQIAHLPFNRGAEHLEDTLRFLAVAQPESQISLAEMFQEFSRYIPDDSNLIVIMSDRDWECLPVMLALEKRNICLIPLILISSTFLYSGDKQREIVDYVKFKLSGAFNFNPILFSRGENPEEVFLKYHER